MHFKYHFWLYLGDYVLSKMTQQGQPKEIIMSWPKHSYSREKALNRADRKVGEMVRYADPGTQFTYTQELP